MCEVLRRGHRRSASGKLSSHAKYGNQNLNMVNQMNPAVPQTDTPVDRGVSRRDFIKGTLAAGAVVGGVRRLLLRLRQGARLAAARRRDRHRRRGQRPARLNPEFIEVKSIADIRPYNVWRAFHGDHSSDAALAVRPGLMAKYGWKTEDEARRHVKVYDHASGGYEELIKQRQGRRHRRRHHRPAAAPARPGGHRRHEGRPARADREADGPQRPRVQGHGPRGRADRACILATGHQRHYNILYANAVDSIQRGVLGDLHYIRAQWHRGNLPGKDSWQQPLPPEVKPGRSRWPRSWSRSSKSMREGAWPTATGAAIDVWRTRVAQVKAQLADKIVEAEKFGYQTDADQGRRRARWSTTRPADRGADPLAAVGPHRRRADGRVGQPPARRGEHLHRRHARRREADAAERVRRRPTGRCSRPTATSRTTSTASSSSPPPATIAKDPFASRKKIGVQYASINGNGFGGYGEIVYGTKGTLILEKEQDMSIIKGPASPSSVKVSGGGGGPTLDTQASGAPTAAAAKSGGGPKVSRGYTEELEHWAWCIRNPAPENQPRCGPKVAMGDAVIALTTNMAARKGKRIEFKKEWFDIDSDETPEGVAAERSASMRSQ